MVSSAAAVEAAGRKAGAPEEDRHYSWLVDYLATIEGKEAREEYYARLEYDLEQPGGGDPRRGTAALR